MGKKMKFKSDPSWGKDQYLYKAKLNANISDILVIVMSLCMKIGVFKRRHCKNEFAQENT